MTTRIVFMGSPEFALPSLRLLAEHYPVVGVITQPDRPAGRGRTLTPPPVKVLAGQLSIPVIQPPRLKAPEAMEQLAAWQPDVIVVAAFGQILRAAVLDLPPFGCINVHASLLPRWRGAAPIHAAILAGDDQTGVTMMRMDPGVDTGPILAQRAEPILPADTVQSLSDRLALLGASLLLETLPAYLSGELTPTPQDSLPGEPTYAPMLSKEDGLLDLTRPAAELARKVRAFNPWPGAYMDFDGQPLKILSAEAVPTPPAHHPTAANSSRTVVPPATPALVTPDGLLLLHEVQPAGKRPMPGKAFIQGARGW